MAGLALDQDFGGLGTGVNYPLVEYARAGSHSLTLSAQYPCGERNAGGVW